MRLRKRRTPPVKVIQIDRKGDHIWLMCADGNAYHFDQDDDGLYLDVEAWRRGG